MRADRIRASDLYIDACRNEHWADRRSLERSGRTVLIAAARYSRFTPVFGEGARALRLTGWGVNLLWPLVAPAFFLAQALRWLRISLATPRTAFEPRARLIWLYFSDGFSAVPDALLEKMSPDLVIVGPNIHAPTRFLDRRQLRVEAVSSLSDITVAYVEAIAAVCRSFGALGFGAVSQTYTGFEWFATRRALQRLLARGSGTSLAYLNHYDRWAILFDRLEGVAERTLVQHGILYDDGELPVRLRNLTRLHVYPGASLESFRRNVLADDCRPTVIEQRPSLHLREVERAPSGAPLVLIIGDPMQASRDVETARALVRDGPAIDLWLKPHPRYPTAPYAGLGAEGVRLIGQRDFFPRADLVLCGMSTLALRYEAAGVPVLRYEGLSVSQAVAEARRMLAA